MRIDSNFSKAPGSSIPYAALGLLLLGVIVYMLPATRNFSAVPGDLGDARFNSYVLEHFYQWLRGDAHKLWDPPFWFPATGMLAFSDNHFGTGIFYAAFRLIGLDREHAFIGWLLFGFALNFAAAYGSLRWLGFRAPAAAIGAFAFAFALPAMTKDGHAQLTYRFCVPIACAAFYKLLSEQRWNLLALVALLVAWEFLASIYLGVFLVYLLAAILLGSLIARRGSLRSWAREMRQAFGTSRRLARWFTAISLFASMAMVAALLLKYRSVGRAYGLLQRPLDQLESMLPRPQSYLLSINNWSTWMDELLAPVPMQHEQLMFAGFVVLLLMACGLVAALRDRSTQGLCARVSGFSLAILVLGTLSVGGYSLYMIVASFPGLVAVRAVSRIVLVMLWPVAVLVALGSQKLLVGAASIGPRLGAQFAFLVIAALLGLEALQQQHSSTPIAQWRERQDVLARLWEHAKIPPHPLLLVTAPNAEATYLSELDAMLFAQDRGIPTINGYSGSAPPGYASLDRCSPAEALLSSYESAGTMRELAKLRAAIPGSVVRLSMEPCPVPIPKGPPHPLTAEEVRQIRVEFVEVKPRQGGLEFTVLVRNEGPVVIGALPALSLSWRTVDDKNAPPSGQPWSTRYTVGYALAPHEDRQITTLAEWPSDPSQKYLQATLVQENHAWLHDLGMPIATIDIPLQDRWR